MNKCFIIFILNFITNISYSQDSLSIKKSDNKEISRLINNIRSYKSFSNDKVSVTLLLTSGKQVDFDGTDEVMDNLFIGISEFDESPNQVLYILEDVFGVKDLIINSINSNEILVKFSSFDLKAKKRKVMSLKITGLYLTRF